MTVPNWLQGARLAPSAHNTQPWQFVAQPDERIAVRWTPERALPVADPTSRDLYLSLGAAIESACLRALTDGAPLQFQPASATAHQDERTVGCLVSAPADALIDPDELALAAVLERRQTARGPHLPSPVPTEIQDSLIAEAQRHGCLLQIVTDRERIARLAKLAGQATALLFADDAVHAELWRWLRLEPASPAYRRDGLTADCLELAGPTLWLARQVMPPARMRWISRLRLHHFLAGDTWKNARESAAICLLSSPAAEPPSLVAAGRVLQRLWLLAAAAGLTTHPLSAILDRPETIGPAIALFERGREAPSPLHGRGEPITPLPRTGEDVDEGPERACDPKDTRAAQRLGEAASSPVAIFRLGYASPAARSPRLPLDELWRDGQTAQD